MSEPCAHERDTSYVRADCLDEHRAIIRRQESELHELRDKVARVEALADACDVKANRIPATVFSITGAIRAALDGLA